MRFLFHFLFVVAVIANTVTPANAEVEQQSLSLDGSGARVPSYSWSDPTVPARAVVLALHGGVQHAAVYAPMAEKLASKGFVVYAIDLRGHGGWLSPKGKRIKLDYHASTADIEAVCTDLRAKHPGLPQFCMGESIGAAVMVHALTHNPKSFDGIILSSAGTNPSVWQDWKAICATIPRGLATFGRSVSVSPFLNRVSDDPRSCKEMKEDPQSRSRASVCELLHMAHFVRENRLLPKKVGDTTPMLMLQGNADRICSPRSARKLFGKFTTKDRHLAVFPETGHLLITTRYLKPEVVTTVSDWLTSHSEPANPMAACSYQSPTNE